MHHRVMITFDKCWAENSEAAREVCYRFLQEEGFVGPYDPNPHPLKTRAWGDWFVVGGRWTHELLEAELPAEDWRKLDPYLTLGYEPDAMVVDERLYDKYLKEYEGESLLFDDFIDLDCENVSRDFIGTRWLVVVDLHI